MPPHEQATRQRPKIIEFRMVKGDRARLKGTKFQAMTFNLSIPGPLIVVHEGDYVELTLVNPETNTMPHNIDFHAATGGLGGGELTLVNPGEQTVLRFKATHTGAPIVRVRIDHSISIMKSAGDRGRLPALRQRRSLHLGGKRCGGQLPSRQRQLPRCCAYADRLSRKTGIQFRLPTDEGWAYAAGSCFHDEGWPDFETDDPARRWLARYRAESERSVPKALQPIGSFGANENGLLDVAGNVWEWTSTCFRRVELGA